MGEQHRAQPDRRRHACAGEPHQHTAAAVHEKLLASDANERRRARPSRIGQRAPGPQRHDVEVAHQLQLSASRATAVKALLRSLAMTESHPSAETVTEAVQFLQAQGYTTDLV